MHVIIIIYLWVGIHIHLCIFHCYLLYYFTSSKNIKRFIFLCYLYLKLRLNMATDKTSDKRKTHIFTHTPYLFIKLTMFSFLSQELARIASYWFIWWCIGLKYYVTIFFFSALHCLFSRILLNEKMLYTHQLNM